MTQKAKKQALEYIMAASSIGLVSHVYGDPDSYGSVLGMQEVLRAMGKKVIIFSEDKIIPIVKDYEPGTEFNPTPNYKKVDLVLMLDLAMEERMSAPISEGLKETRVIIMDHHKTKDEEKPNFTYIINEKASSASEICYEFCKEEGLEITKKAAGYFYLGIYGDTNGFRFSNTTEKALEIAKEIEKMGDFRNRAAEAFERDKKVKEGFFKLALSRVQKSKVYPALVSYLTLRDFNDASHTEIASQAANYIEENSDENLAVFVLLETKVGTKVSMRSNNSSLNVRKIAEKFHGGGHDKAAGIISERPLAEMAEELGAELEYVSSV